MATITIEISDCEDGQISIKMNSKPMWSKDNPLCYPPSTPAQTAGLQILDMLKKESEKAEEPQGD